MRRSSDGGERLDPFPARPFCGAVGRTDNQGRSTGREGAGDLSLSPATKLLVTIEDYILKQIPGDPSSPEFRQGNTLGKDNRHWFRAKFHGRYRLFFRFSTEKKIIIYVWVNDEKSLRKAGAKTDPYTVFQTMLRSGNPPQSLDHLLAASKKLNKEELGPAKE
jgi:mRNA-degrading endonuclease RelE of RelBE toxin-antitoxin system